MTNWQLGWCCYHVDYNRTSTDRKQSQVFSYKNLNDWGIENFRKIIEHQTPIVKPLETDSAKKKNTNFGKNRSLHEVGLTKQNKFTFVFNRGE